METSTEKISLLSKKDRKHIWHPFTQMQTTRYFKPITKGRGIYLFDEEGNRYIDGTSSWWVNLHGHTHPYIVEKVQVQVEMLEHVTFADFTHPPAIDLASRLIELLPGAMTKVFYSDNGSTSVEIALKMALQYWTNLHPNTSKNRVVCFKHSYHGETFGAMSVTGKSPINKPFWSYLFEVDVIDPPLPGQEESSLYQLENILKLNQTACFIFEPLILGVGGMKIYSSESLDKLIQLCRYYEVLIIADEVMTGFGRTNTLFACQQLVQKPDIICLSKGLTGGFLPLAITACSEKIFEAFLGEDLRSALLHGHSYTANPLGCVSALASLELLLDKNCFLQREMIAEQHAKFSQKWKAHSKLKRCESLGTILVLEYHTCTPSYFQSMRDALYYYFYDRGILLRPLGNVLYVLPPYCILQEELEFIYEHIILHLETNI